APTTYTSLAAFNNKLYVAFIRSTPPYELLLRSTSDGQSWSADLIPLNSSQREPMSAPFIIPFNDQLYAFWIRAFNDPPFSDRHVVFKVSKDGETWPAGTGTSFGVVVDQRSGISGFVLNSIIEDPTCVGKCQPISGPPRLHILYLRNIRNPFIDVKSIGA